MVQPFDKNFNPVKNDEMSGLRPAEMGRAALYQLKGRDVYVIASKVQELPKNIKPVPLRITYELAKGHLGHPKMRNILDTALNNERVFKYSNGFRGKISELISKLKNLIFRPEHQFKSTADIVKDYLELNPVPDSEPSEATALKQIEKQQGKEAEKFAGYFLKGGKLTNFERADQNTYRFTFDSENQLDTKGQPITLTRGRMAEIKVEEKNGQIILSLSKDSLNVKVNELPAGTPFADQINGKKFDIASIAIDQEKAHITLRGIPYTYTIPRELLGI